MTSLHAYARNRRWLDDRLNEYPHRCRTKVQYPRPEDVKAQVPGLDFIRAPLFKEAEWGFKTHTEMAAFKATFVTEENRLTETPLARIIAKSKAPG